MGNLSIVIYRIKIEIKIHQNFLPCLLVLFVVCSYYFWPFQRGFSELSSVAVELKLAKIALERPEMLRTYHKQDKQTRFLLRNSLVSLGYP